MKEPVKAFGLVSGGLDSALAVALLVRQGIEVLGLHYFNGFSTDALKAEVRGAGSTRDVIAQKGRELEGSLGIPVEVVDISEEYLALLVSPRHGYGRNVNPCIDCRIFMLAKTRERIERGEAGFVFTGEVLGQRPMSQQSGAMRMVQRESGLGGLLLRPLCARLLPPTIPEEKGWVRRSELLDIQGRSRKRQLRLADELGITGYSTPAGGCILTDENYARRFNDYIIHTEQPALSRREAVLLSVGRHLRLSARLKIVVGREEAENRYLEAHWTDFWLATTLDQPGPTVVIQGEPSEEDFEKVAAITARYSDGKNLRRVRVGIRRDGVEKRFTTAPASDDLLHLYRI